MSAAFFNSSLFTRGSRPPERDRLSKSLQSSTPRSLSSVTDAGSNQAGSKTIKRLSRAHSRNAHPLRKQKSFLPDLADGVDEDDLAENGIMGSFLPFGEPETLVPRRSSLASSSASSSSSSKVVAYGQGRRSSTQTLTPSVASAEPHCPWGTTGSAPPSHSSSAANGGRPDAVARDLRSPSYEARSGPATTAFDKRHSTHDEVLRPVMAIAPIEGGYNSVPEWRDTILEEDSDDWESPLAPLDALEGFCDGDATSDIERRLATTSLPPPARASSTSTNSTLPSRPLPRSGQRQAQVMPPLASRIRKLSGVTQSSRSSAGSSHVNRATQVESLSPTSPPSHRLSVPIHLGPLPPLPRTACDADNCGGGRSVQHFPVSEGDERPALTDNDTPERESIALGLSFAGTQTCAHDDPDQPRVTSSYIIPPEERSRIGTEPDSVDRQSRFSSPAPSVASTRSEHSVDTLLVPSELEQRTQSSPIPASPFLCPSTPVGLFPPPRRRSAPGSSRNEWQ